MDVVLSPKKFVFRVPDSLLVHVAGEAIIPYFISGTAEVRTIRIVALTFMGQDTYSVLIFTLGNVRDSDTYQQTSKHCFRI